METKRYFEFTENQVTAMADFVAQLERNCLHFNVITVVGGWRIEILYFD